MHIGGGAAALAGAVLGASVGFKLVDVNGALVGGVLGLIVGWLLARRAGDDDSTTAVPPPAPAYRPVSDGGAGVDAPERPHSTHPHAAVDLAGEVLRRLDAVDARLARIEARLAGSGHEPVAAHARLTGDALTDSVAQSRTRAAQPPPPEAPIPLQPRPIPHASASPASGPVATPPAPGQPAPVTSIGAQPASIDAVEGTPGFAHAAGAHASSRSTDSVERATEALADMLANAGGGPNAAPFAEAARSSGVIAGAWAWISGGNTLTRIGIVILFFGVAFLLRHFAEIASIRIEVKLAAAALGGVLLALLGVRLSRARLAYGLSLEGAGAGIVYLVVFAGFRLYDVLSPAVAIALLILAALATIVLALRHDSEPLAALALAGGFLAPVLIQTEAAAPAPLFGYFAVLNAAIFMLAWRRAWRLLNVLGFVFTFVLGAHWGARFYTPAHYATVQPFLILFFLFYVGIAVRYAGRVRGSNDVRAAVDGIMVFGVPIVGFALQMAITRENRYGVAISAGTLGLFYAALWSTLRGRVNPGLAMLARACGALAVIFATLAIPFAVDSRATSAWWALEAAGVYWLGVAQRQRIARAFALVMQALAALVFLGDYQPAAAGSLFNANLVGVLLIGAASLASVWAADRHPGHIGTGERRALGWMSAWGMGWWVLGGVIEMTRQVAHPGRIDIALAWVAASTAVALALYTWLRWPRIAWMSAWLLPAMFVAGVADLQAEGTTLTHWGWLAWPAAWALTWAALRAVQHWRDAAGEFAGAAHDGWIHLGHAVAAIALVAWMSYEASEWVGRHALDETVWMACAGALPSIMYLVAIVHWAPRAGWPFSVHAEAYGASAGTTIAALLFAWFLIVNVAAPGDPAPLPYLPVLNPIDLTLIAALASLWTWARAWSRTEPRLWQRWLGAAAFLALNAAVVRTAHHWGDVPWQTAALMAYKPLQAALTLTWTGTALALMLWSTRRRTRAPWMIGGALLVIVVVKLFAIDLASLSGLTRVIAFMGVGALLLVIGYMAPLPPSMRPADTGAAADALR